MRLNPAGVEYARWDVEGLPTTPPAMEASFDGGTTWTETVYDESPVVGSAAIASLLVAGPEAADPGDAVVLALGRNLLLTRLVDNPEVIIRASPGFIDVK